MKHTFTASVTQEDDWYVAQCLDVDVASQGATGEEALVNLGEALALYFTPPDATALPDLRLVEVEIGAAWAAALPGSQAKAGGGRLHRDEPAAQSYRVRRAGYRQLRDRYRVGTSATSGGGSSQKLPDMR